MQGKNTIHCNEILYTCKVKTPYTARKYFTHARQKPPYTERKYFTHERQNRHILKGNTLHMKGKTFITERKYLHMKGKTATY